MCSLTQGGCCGEDAYEHTLKSDGLRGPWQHKRHCTNPIMLLLFISFLIGYIAIMMSATPPRPHA